jgi:hypothetical protein
MVRTKLAVPWACPDKPGIERHELSTLPPDASSTVAIADVMFAFVSLN